MKGAGVLLIIIGGLVIWWANHYAVGHQAGAKSA